MTLVDFLTIYCQKLEETKAFYEQLGLSFVQERHGTGPLHYAATAGNCTIELYPTKKEPTRITFGLSVLNLDHIVSHVQSAVRTSDSQAKVTDPEGRLIFLTADL